MNDQHMDALDDLRREIDRIDTAIAELLAERHALSGRIGAQKAGGADVLRPGREAQILRRLIADIGDRVPASALVRIWREIFAASARAQAKLAVAVCAPSGERRIWDLARQHFGGATSLVRVDRPAHALRTLADDEAQAAVLPAPADDEVWWRSLVEPTPRLHVIVRLPFDMGGGSDADAFVVARAVPDPSGDDVSLLAVAAPLEVSRGRLRDLLADLGLEAAWRAVARLDVPAEALHLIEVRGFLEQDDARLAALVSKHPHQVERCVRLGAWARPIDVGDG